MDIEYYLKIVPAEIVHSFWGASKFFEFSSSELIINRDPRAPKI